MKDLTAKETERRMVKKENERNYIMLTHVIARAVHNLGLVPQRLMYAVLITLASKRREVREELKEEILKIFLEVRITPDKEMEKRVMEARDADKELSKIIKERLGDGVIDYAEKVTKLMNCYEKEIIVPMSELYELTGYKRSGRAKELVMKGLEDLMNKTIKIQTEEGVQIFNVLDSVTYREKMGLVVIRVGDSFLRYSKVLKGNYEQIYIDELIGIKGYYTMKLYELLKSWESKIGKAQNKAGEWYVEISIPDVKEYLGIIGNSYVGNREFMQKVVRRAITEINENKELSMEIKELETEKQWRELKKIKFICKRRLLKTAKLPKEKPPQEKPIQKPEEPQPTLETETLTQTAEEIRLEMAEAGKANEGLIARLALNKNIKQPAQAGERPAEQELTEHQKAILKLRGLS